MKCNRRVEGGCCGHSSSCVSSLIERVRMWAWVASVSVPAIECGHDWPTFAVPGCTFLLPEITASLAKPSALCGRLGAGARGRINVVVGVGITRRIRGNGADERALGAE